MGRFRGHISGIRKQQGFTLLEMLIAVIILGILAAIIIPQISVSTDDAKVSAVKSNLAAMRNSIEQYCVQHGNTYPGARLIAGTGPTTTVGEASAAFVLQLTGYSQFTTNNGKASLNSADLLTTETIFGPYIKGGGLPVNPFNNKNDVLCDITTTDISTRTPDGTTGWKFVVKTGMLFANDNLSSGGTAHSTY